jgi:hypothetical protein
MNKLQKIKLQIEELKQEVIDIQEQCTHPPLVLVKEYNSNTGNYDPSQDCYWINYHCELCEKRWREEQ